MTFEYIFSLTDTSIFFATCTEIRGQKGSSRYYSSPPTSAFSKYGSCWVNLEFSPIRVASFVWCRKLSPLSSVVVIYWQKVEIRYESNYGLVVFIQITREINCSMITKKEKNRNLKYVTSKFKDEYWDNTKYKKNNKRGRSGGKGCYSVHYCSTRLILIQKDHFQVRYVILLWN